jgi:tRNA1(Val) A37 N6-methylase TrmN6
LGRYTYYGAFAPGLEECIAEVLKERSPELAVPLLLSGAVVFETSLSYDRLNLFCFNNIFRVIAADPKKEGPPGGGRPSRESLENFVRNTIRRKAGRGSIPGLDRGDSSPGASSWGPEAGFRVIFSLENSPAALGEGLRGEAESRISSLTGLRVNRARPGVEFWFLLRREGAFFMRRLSRHRPWDKLLHPGELPPPLAWMLCRLSNPRSGEKAADPFCGYGSIPAARLRHFPQAEFFASDTDRGALKIARGKFRGKPQHRCHFNCLDAGELPRVIPPASLDSIITDPPWGLYQKPGSGAAGGSPGERGAPAAPNPTAELYERSLAVFSGLLKPGGSLVMLCGRGEELKAAAKKNSFTIIRNIPILLSGRKAAILILRPPR